MPSGYHKKNGLPVQLWWTGTGVGPGPGPARSGRDNRSGPKLQP